MHRINITEAKKRFAEIICRVSTGECFMIRQRERMVAVLVSPSEFRRMERMARAAFNLVLAFGQNAAILERVERGEIHSAMAAFGLWRNEDDLENLAEQIEARQNTTVSRL